jgi:CRISPR type IV-associated protein Csf2
MSQTNETTELRKYLIEGVLRTVSPLHITEASADKARWVPGTGEHGYGRIRYGKEGFPLTLTRSAPFFLGTRLTKEEGGEEGHAVSVQETVPIIPASTWRGALRRGAARVIEDHVIEQGEKLSYQAYMGMHCGAVSGNPDGVPPSTDEIKGARRHVFYGIFGGGPRMLRGNLRVADSVPVTADMIERGFLPERLLDEALRGVHTRNLYTVSPVVRKDDFMDNASDAEAVVVDFVKTFDDARAQQVQRLLDKAGETDPQGSDAVRGVRTLSYRQDVAAGVPFYFRAELHGTPAQVGLLLAALDRRLADGIGGRSAIGLGCLSGTLTVAERGKTAVPVLAAESGNVTFLDGAMDYLDAQAEEVSILSLPELNSYMTPTSMPSSDDAPAKGKGRGKAKKESV